MSALRTLWQAILSPSRPDETPYESAVIVLAHAVIGAAAASLVAELAVPAAVLRMFGPATYWWIKERADLRLGGSFRDGLWDTAAITSGLAYGTGRWPAATLALALAAALDRGRHTGDAS